MATKSNINFLVIGAQKAGTTWLDFSLRNHPDAWLPPTKELHYFDTQHSVYAVRRESAYKALEKALGSPEMEQRISKNPNARRRLMTLSKLAFEEYSDAMYLSIFAGITAQAVGEVTPEYSVLPEAGVAHIRELLGDVKIIYMLRHPVARAWSAFRMSVDRGELANTLSACLRSSQTLESAQLIYDAITKPSYLAYLDSRTNYQQTSCLFEQYFSQVHYIIYDQLCRAPLNVLQEVCSFLNLEFQASMFADQIDQRKNQGIKLEMPHAVRELLTARYAEQSSFVQEKFYLQSDQFSL